MYGKIVKNPKNPDFDTENPGELFFAKKTRGRRAGVFFNKNTPFAPGPKS